MRNIYLTFSCSRLKYAVQLNVSLDYLTWSSSQGDRGFDGLPGLPGEKGHRVSIQIQDAAYVCDNCSVFAAGLDLSQLELRC